MSKLGLVLASNTNKKVKSESGKKAKKATTDVRPKILITSRIWIPKSEVDMRSIKKNYITNMYNQQACKLCDNFPERHNYLCDSCPAFLERIVLFDSKLIQGKPYVGLPLGDKKNIERKARIDFKEFKVVDKRTLAPFTYPIKFTAKLRPVQEKLVEDFLQHKYGMLVAPPRTGKTVTSLYISLQLGQRTLVMASQHEFLTQFEDHIHGNEKEGIPKCTNLPELEKKHELKLYGFPKTDADFKNFQFLLMTYQAFISEKNGKNRLALIKDNVGTLFIDEAHKSNATCFARTVSSIRTRYKFGCSGTVQRKDKREFIAEALLGPINATTSIEALIPTVYVHHTTVEGRKYAPGPASWVYATQYLAGHKKRNALIVDRVIKDLTNGHNIVIPVTFKNHVLELQNLINTAYGSNICGTFMGGGGKKNTEDRKNTLSLVKENKLRVTVGIRSLLQLGLNVPSWSCIVECMPISNEPNLKQETARICTPKEGKRPPIIRLFVDLNQPQSAGCARSSIGHMKKFKYSFASSEKQQEALYAVLSTGNSRREDPDDTTPTRTQKRTKGVTADIPRGLFKDTSKKRL